MNEKNKLTDGAPDSSDEGNIVRPDGVPFEGGVESQREKDRSGLKDNSGSTNKTAPESLGGLLSHFVETTQGQDKVAISDLLDSLSSRSHGPMLLFPAIIAISPVGMIPGMSFVTGALIILIATQMMFFASRPWIPKRVAGFEFSREKLENGVNKTKRWVKWFERIVCARFEFLARGLMIYPISIVCVVLAISFFPLAFVPFGVLAPGFAITMFALGLTARDGILVMFGFLLAAVACCIIWSVWPF